MSRFLKDETGMHKKCTIDIILEKYGSVLVKKGVPIVLVDKKYYKNYEEGSEEGKKGYLRYMVNP